MAKVGKYATRPLDEFESAALPVLERGEDLVKEVKENELRVLGSIRAMKQCLTCHDVQRGDLLGAFTYVLKGDAK